MAISPYPPSTGGGSTGSTSAVDTTTFAGDNVKDTFLVPHGMATTPRYANVVAKNPNAIGENSVVWDATNITVMYSTPPATGPVILTWIVVL